MTLCRCNRNFRGLPGSAAYFFGMFQMSSLDLDIAAQACQSRHEPDDLHANIEELRKISGLVRAEGSTFWWNSSYWTGNRAVFPPSTVPRWANLLFRPVRQQLRLVNSLRAGCPSQSTSWLGGRLASPSYVTLQFLRRLRFGLVVPDSIEAISRNRKDVVWKPDAVAEAMPRLVESEEYPRATVLEVLMEAQWRKVEVDSRLRRGKGNDNHHAIGDEDSIEILKIE